MEKVVGILGGMGPQATLDLLGKIIAATPARTERDHLRLLVDCNPKVPDRVAAIQGVGPDPTPMLVDMARGLVSQGAGLLAIACNTAHYFLPAVQAAVPVPVLDMIGLTARRAAGLRSAGLLSTSGAMGLYRKAFTERGIELLTLGEADQAEFMALVKGVKVGLEGPEARAAMTRLAHTLLGHGAGVVVAGCTEVPLLLAGGPDLPVLDPTQVLAEAIVTAMAE